MTNSKPYILALDVGARRIGVALARRETGLASTYRTLLNDETIWDQLRQIIDQEEVGAVVLGLPRGLEGQETAQTRAVQEFGALLEQKLGLPIAWQDEAVTSVQAEEELRAAGRRYNPLRTGHYTVKRYNKEMIDAQAAAIILQDYLDNHKELRI